MKKGVTITVGVENAGIVGSDNRALQAAVDYVSGLGGGTVYIGAGVYEMEDSLHLRSNVTVIGAGKDTVLRKGSGHISPLVTDGDYGEEQITAVDGSGFKVGMGVTVGDDRSGGFHTTVGTIIARVDENTFIINSPLQADCMVDNNAIAKNTFPLISGYYAENIRIEGVTVDGNRASNAPLKRLSGRRHFLLSRRQFTKSTIAPFTTITATGSVFNKATISRLKTASHIITRAWDFTPAVVHSARRYGTTQLTKIETMACSSAGGCVMGPLREMSFGATVDMAFLLVIKIQIISCGGIR